ncbi:MAG: serine/threonine protein kinase, partial [Betaproteobacteria bacterium]|nr:serine/threonine protein kinase [Betaproteobacteria bacterium]
GAAFSSAIEQVYVAQQFCGWLRHRFPGRGRQDFAVCIALDRIDIDIEEGDAPVADPALRAAALRLASFTALGGRRGWSLVATQAAIDSSKETCGAGEGLLIRTEDGGQEQIFEVAAVALNSTTSVHERIARILQSNSSMLKYATGASSSHRSLDGTTSKRGAHSTTEAVGRATGNRDLGGQTVAGGTPITTAEPVEAITEGVQIAGYRIIRPLGKGGMAEVFLASHTATGEERVLKLLPIKDGEEEQLQRFIQEYALISQIQDANVARIFEQGFTQNHAFIAMEFLPGGELRAVMKQGLSLGQVLDWATAIARALKAVHAKGIAHRDLKPSNLMLRADGTLVLADFGIAKGQSDLLHRTINGHIVGSPYYLSPEQAESKPVDARCDLYSLGIILFEMLTGKKPYRASNLSDLIRMHVIAPIPRLPEELAPFQGLIDHLLAKRPSERIASAALVVSALDDLRGRVHCAETNSEFSSVASESPAARAAATPEVYSVAVIGFDETEKIVLGSTLGLSVRRTPRFVEFTGGPAERPDIFLVDARDLLYLQTMLASNLDRAIPTVLIGTSDFGTRWPVIKRPLQWTKIFEAFDRVLREQALQAS